MSLQVNSSNPSFPWKWLKKYKNGDGCVSIPALEVRERLETLRSVFHSCWYYWIEGKENSSVIGLGNEGTLKWMPLKRASQSGRGCRWRQALKPCEGSWSWEHLGERHDVLGTEQSGDSVAWITYTQYCLALLGGKQTEALLEGSSGCWPASGQWWLCMNGLQAASANTRRVFDLVV